MRSTSNNKSDDLMSVINLFNTCGFNCTNFKTGTENKNYGACSFRLNEFTVVYRESNITPKKAGQFVAIWKRDVNGVTAPYDESDEIDFLIISSRSKEKFGQFIFPKSLLLSKNIISNKNNGGKRGMRVYPPWDKATSKQAIKTQQWQLIYFLDFQDKGYASNLRAIVV